MSRRPPNQEFSVAIFCARPYEADCVVAAFDHEWASIIENADGDKNSYSCGSIAGHNVVVAHLPGRGKVNATLAAAGVSTTFTQIKHAFVVGICGGMPFDGNGDKILLGDVILSQALVQYDFGRHFPHSFEAKHEVEDALPRPSHELRSLLAKFKTLRGRRLVECGTLEHLRGVQEQVPSASFPDPKTDVLYDSSYVHKHRDFQKPCSSCDEDPEQSCQEAQKTECGKLGCDLSKPIRRRSQQSPDGSADHLSIKPKIHIGRLGCADKVLRSGRYRDELAKKEKLIGFDMEAAGIWDVFQNSLAIKAVSTYADSHEDNSWRNFSAATAAACLKAVLAELNPPRPQNHETYKKPLSCMVFDESNMADLTGGDDLPKEGHYVLFQPEKHSRAALPGLDGVANTRLAMDKAAHRKELCPECSVVRFQATNTQAFENNGLTLGKLLKIPQVDASGSEPQSLICTHLKNAFAGKWLLIRQE